MIKTKLVIAILTFTVSCASSAGVIEFDTCQSRCGFIQSEPGAKVPSIATLEFTDNGQNGVDFLLTNNLGNQLPGNDTSFVPRFFFGLATIPTKVSNASSNIDFFDFDGTMTSGFDFDVEVNLANILSTGLRLTNGESASFTFEGIDTSAVLSPALLQIIERDAEGTVGSRLLGSFSAGSSNPIQQVPEPGPLGVTLAAIALLGFRAKHKVATKS